MWREIHNATFYILTFLVRSLKWKQYFCTNTCWNNLLLNMAVRLGCILRDGRGTRKEGALISNLYLISHQWYHVEKLTVPGSSNLNLFFMGIAKRFVLKRWKKNVLHFFIKFNEKFSPKLWEKYDFPAQKLGLFFQS